MKIPVDIVGLIVRHFRDDTPSLRSCSLVDRTWLSSSWRYLFYRLHLTLDKKCYPKFIKFLRSSPSFCTHVRSFRLSGSDSKYSNYVTAWATETELSVVVNAFPRLHTFIFEGFRMKDQDSRQQGPDSPSPYRRQRDMSKVVIADVDYVRRTAFIRLLSAFSSIQELQLLAVQVRGIEDEPKPQKKKSKDDSKTPQQSDTLPPLAIKQITFDYNVVFRSISAASFFGHFPHLKATITSLDMPYPYCYSRFKEDCRLEVEQLLQELGPQLQHLRLDYLHKTRGSLGTSRPYSIAICTDIVWQNKLILLSLL